MHHKLKIGLEYFRSVASGEKSFELRYNDRNFCVDDTVDLLAYEKGTFIGSWITIKITYLLENYKGLNPGYCIFSFKIIPGTNIYFIES